MLDASAISAVLTPLADSSDFVQVGGNPDSTPVAVNGEAENTPPENLQIIPLADVFENNFAQLKFTFDDPDFLDTHVVEINWGDNTTPQIINLTGGERFVSTSHQYLDDNPTPMPIDVNQVTITVTDSQGEQVSGGAPINVFNSAPVIDSLVVTPSELNESQTAELQLKFTDPGTLDTHTVTIDWDDGTAPQVINLIGGERSLITSHTYLDDNPTNTPFDFNNVKVTVTDDDMGMDMAQTVVKVNNVAPTIDSLTVSPDMINENETVTLQLKFTDPGTLDTHTVTIDWDDGTAPQIITLTGGERSLQTSHKYLDDNPTNTPFDDNHVTVTVTDDDTGASDAAMATVRVTNLVPTVTLNPVTMIDENGSAMLSGSISDVGTLDTFTTIMITWGDPLSPDNVQMLDLGTVARTEAVDGINWNPDTKQFSLTHQYLDDNPTNTDNDPYTITVKATDDDTGVSMAAETTVNVNNVAPTIEPLAVTSPIDENGVATLSGTINDVGTLDTFTTIMISWGDPLSPDNVQMLDLGTVARTEAVDGINWNPDTKQFSLTHQYLDDNPTNTDNDPYTITVEVTDDDTGVGMAETTVTVNNVVPDVTLDPIPSIIESGTITLSGSVSDVGTLDTFTTLTVDWGFSNVPDDTETFELGTVARTELADGINWDPTTQTYSLSHQYLDNDDDNVFTITVTIEDDDTGEGVNTVDVTVFNVNPSFVDVDPEGPNVIVATDVTPQGLTTLTLQFTDPGVEAAFLQGGLDPHQVLVDWGDMLFEPDLDARFVVEDSLNAVPGGPLVYVHQYTGPPDPLHPAADITIRVKFRDDDFYNATPLVDPGESVIAEVVISNPGIGAEPFVIDTTPQVPRLEFARETQSVFFAIDSNSSEANLQGADVRATSGDSKATTEQVFVLRVVDPYDNEGEGIRLKADVLKKLPELFAKLPDNEYRIYKLRVETNTERLVIEVYVRNGKLIDPKDVTEGTRDRPPTDEATGDQQQQQPDDSQPDPNVSANMQEVLRVLEAEITPDSEILVKPVDENLVEPIDSGAMHGTPGVGLLPVAAGLVATRSFGSWAEQVDRAVAEAGPKKWRELRQRSRNRRKNR